MSASYICFQDLDRGCCRYCMLLCRMSEACCCETLLPKPLVHAFSPDSKQPRGAAWQAVLNAFVFLIAIPALLRRAGVCLRQVAKYDPKNERCYWNQTFRLQVGSGCCYRQVQRSLSFRLTCPPLTKT